MEAWWMHAYRMEASRMLMIVSCVAHSGLAKVVEVKGKTRQSVIGKCHHHCNSVLELAASQRTS